MKNLKYCLVALLAFAVAPWVSIPTSAHSAPPQSPGSTALERGYRTGYSDGYNSGFKDTTDHAARDYQNKDEYRRADRAYVDVWGPIEDYRDGYQQGYEAGYGAGFDKGRFQSEIPPGFKRRHVADTQGSVSNGGGTSSGVPTDPTQTAPSTQSTVLTGTVLIPRDTTLLIELENAISTDVSQQGDKFQARVVEPREYAGAIVQGHVSRLQRPKKVKGAAELQLSFEELRLPDGRVAAIHGELVEVVAAGGSEGVGEVDREGGVKGKDQTKNDIAKVGAGAGVGALIGVIVGGGKGAAIGAAIGGGVGTGGVLSTRGKDIRLVRGQQLRIRTSTDTRVQ